MKPCTFCSTEAPMTFSHLTNDIGKLGIQCYLQFHGSCSICSSSLVPVGMKPDVDYQLQAKFISLKEKSILVCDPCHAAICNEFPQLLG